MPDRDPLDALEEELDERSERLGEHIDEARRESHQLPEEAPAEQVPDDDSKGGARDDAEETPGVPGEDDRGTGHQPDE